VSEGEEKIEGKEKGRQEGDIHNKPRLLFHRDEDEKRRRVEKSREDEEKGREDKNRGEKRR
jgi:hypothetical protein